MTAGMTTRIYGIYIRKATTGRVYSSYSKWSVERLIIRCQGSQNSKKKKKTHIIILSSVCPNTYQIQCQMWLAGLVCFKLVWQVSQPGQMASPTIKTGPIKTSKLIFQCQCLIPRNNSFELVIWFLVNQTAEPIHNTTKNSYESTQFFKWIIKKDSDVWISLRDHLNGPNNHNNNVKLKETVYNN